MKLFFLLLSTVSMLLSAPAFHAQKSFELETGETFQGYLKGDEHLNWIESDSGEVLLFSKERNRYEYAQIKDNELVTSGIAKILHVKSRRTLPSVSKKELYKLWEKRRQREFQRQKAH